MAEAQCTGNTYQTPWSWLTAESAWLCMLNIKGGRLVRWQILKAAAKERDYSGPITQKAIEKDLRSAQSAWLQWLSMKVSNMVWLHLKLEMLLEKEKFHQFRHLLFAMHGAETSKLR
jgi:hypothetical protein